MNTFSINTQCIFHIHTRAHVVRTAYMAEDNGLSNGQHSIQVGQSFTLPLLSLAVDIVLLDVVQALFIALESNHNRAAND